MADLTFVPGCFAYAKCAGSPYWPCVVYTRFEEIPPEQWQGRLKKPLKPKEDEVIVYWLEDWQFSVVKKKSVKATTEVLVEALLKEVKNKGQRVKLQAAIDSMLEMEKLGEEDPELDAAVIRPGQEPQPAPGLVAQPEPEAAAAAPAKGGGSKKVGKKAAATAAAPSGGEAAAAEAPAAAANNNNNKKRKKASDAPPVQAPAVPAAVEAVAAPAGKQAGKRSKSTGGKKGGPGEGPADGGAAAGGAGAGASGRSKGKRKLPAGAGAAAAAVAAAAQQQQQQLMQQQHQDPPLDMMAAAALPPAGAADGGKKKARRSSTPRAPRQPKQQGGGEGAAFAHGRRDSETMAAAALVGLSPEPKQQQQHRHQEAHPHAHAHAYHHQQQAAYAQYQQYYAMHGYPPHGHPHYAQHGYPQHAQHHQHHHQQWQAHMAAHLQQAPPPGPPYALPAPVPAAPMAPPGAEGKQAAGRKRGEGGRGRKSSSAASASPAAAAATATPTTTSGGDGSQAAVEGKEEGEAPAVAAAPEVAAVPPAVDDDTQENPFLAPWKDIDPDALARGMQSYALWAPGTFAGFAPDDTRPAPGDESWANGGEGAAGAQGRPGRKASGRKSMRVSDRLHEIQQGKLPPHTLLICEEFGLKADGAVNAQGGQGLSTHHVNASQPFHVKVHPDVAFICDLHAHLADSEIIGFLAGRFDAETRTLFVQAPFPCRATARADDGSTDVEMDPGSEIEVRDVIDRSQMTVVGWYHSHPTFAPEPSLIDIENQHQYQQLMRDEGTGAEPFVGLIVGTYDDSVKQPVSLFRFFHVRRIKMNSSARAGTADSGVNFPMAMEVYVGHNDKPEEEEAEVGTVKEEHKGAGMDLLAAVTFNLPSLPTPTSSPRAGAAASATTEEEKPKAEGEAGEANGNGGAAAGAAGPVVAADRRSQSIFLAVKEKRHRELPSSKEIWASIEARFLSAPEGEGEGGGGTAHLACLRCTLETVRLLVEYYSRLPTRVDFEEEWRRGTNKGEKFELSLRKRVNSLPGLGPDPARRQAFLESLLEFIVAAWVEGTPRRLPQPEDFSGTRRERQKQAAAAREAVLAAEAAAAAQEAGAEKGKASPAAAAKAKVPSIPPLPPAEEEDEAAPGTAAASAAVAAPVQPQVAPEPQAYSV